MTFSCISIKAILILKVDIPLKPKQATNRVKVCLGVMGMKAYSIFPKGSALEMPFWVIIRTLSGGEGSYSTSAVMHLIYSTAPAD